MRRLKDKGKMYILSNCKESFSMSQFLCVDDLCYSHKRAIARIRSSAHKFPIEVGRYANVPREEKS